MHREKFPICFLPLLVAAVLPLSHLPAAVVVLTPSKDNTIYQIPASNSNGQGEFIFTGRTGPSGQNSIRRALLAFDIAGSIPTGSNITSVSLSLTMSQSPPGATDSLISLFAVLADWGEGASNASGNEGTGTGAATGDATWNRRFFNSTSWITAGGDFDSVASASALVGSDEINPYIWTGAGLVDDVQAWLDSPASNFGWMLRGNETTTTTARRFDSRNNSTASVRPQLTITYSPVPEPAVFGLLTIGLLPFLRRFRRHVRNPISFE